MSALVTLSLATLAGPASAAPRTTIGASAPDPVGGERWTARTWKRSQASACLQVGHRRGTALVRRSRGGERALTRRDRAICGRTATDEGVEWTPIAIERLVDDPEAAEPRPARTIVAGVARRDVVEVVLRVRGRRRVIPLHGPTRTWLAVLDGSVRRADLKLGFRTKQGRPRTIDFATGDVGDASDERVVPGTIGRALFAPHRAADGTPLDLVTYRMSEAGLCAEAGRVLGDEVGAYHPGWGSFADAPSLMMLDDFEDDWRPSGPSPEMSEGCTESGSAFPGLRVQRLTGDGEVVVHGFAPGAIVNVRGPSGALVPVSRGARATFLATVPSTGARGEALTLTRLDADGRLRTRKVWLGPNERPVGGWTYEVEDGGRTLRLDWTAGGGTPFAGVDVRDAGDALAVKALELYRPDFTADGMGIAYSLVGIQRCVNVALDAPLGNRRVLLDDDRGLRTPRRARPVPDLPGFEHGGPRCPTVRPGQRVQAGP